MLKKVVLSLSLALGLAAALPAQKLATASKVFDIDAGGSFVYGDSDYGRKIKGYGGFGTIDFRPHLGLMLDFHQANGSDLVYERTYEVGARYVRHYGRANPYAKVMIGRGVFNFPPYFAGGPSSANLAYNMLGLGGGLDYRLRRHIDLRGDFEYQMWGSDKVFLQNGLSPYLGSIGAAYHF